MTFSSFASSTNEDNYDENDVDVIRWKLYGKNKAFVIIYNAATKIQAFWRGCSSRAKTSIKIQNMIEDITALRKLEAEYKKRDEEEHRKYQQDHDPNRDQKEENDKNRNKPWRTATEDDDSDGRMANLVTPTKEISRVRKEEEEQSEENHVDDLLESADGDTRGYRRYRTNIHGKNKTRPWRDDTNVFDAY